MPLPRPGSCCSRQLGLWLTCLMCTQPICEWMAPAELERREVHSAMNDRKSLLLWIENESAQTLQMSLSLGERPAGHLPSGVREVLAFQVHLLGIGKVQFQSRALHRATSWHNQEKHNSKEMATIDEKIGGNDLAALLRILSKWYFQALNPYWFFASAYYFCCSQCILRKLSLNTISPTLFSSAC